MTNTKENTNMTNENTIEPELAAQLAHAVHLDDGTVRLSDGTIVYEYRWRQLRSRLAVQKGGATKKARKAHEAQARFEQERRNG